MQQNNVAPCGINCALCDIYVATKADSNEKRAEVAEKWTKLFHHNFLIDDINCDGCLGDGKLGIYCGTMCEVRPCAISRALQNCEACPEYECEKLMLNRKHSAQYIQ